MAFDRQQHVGKAAEHMRPDRFALVSARHRQNLVGRNAEMVRPEPDQPLDKAELSFERGVEPRFGFLQENLLR